MLMQQSPFSRRRLPLWRCRRWSGAVVQDNCETDARTQSKFHTHFCEPRAGALRIRSRSATASTTSSYLVDPASSHMLVLKIKPCMSKCFDCLTLDCRRLIKTVMVYLMVHCYLDNRSNSRANTCTKGRLTKPCIY